jgi:hypothetical protein
MARFLIEVPHSSNTLECSRAVAEFLRAGSHFLTHADWGCKDGDHRAWVILDVDSKDEARNVIPPMFRAHAKVVQLNSFTLQDVEPFLRKHDSH